MERNSKYFLIALIALMLMTSGPVHAGQGLLQAGPTATGPLGVFPAWYMDKNGLPLEGCLDGPPNCLNSLADLSNSAVGEAFYWWSNADLAHPNGISQGFVEIALEMAFLDPLAVPFVSINNAMVFNRLRVRLTGLPAAGRYIIAHPFGRVAFAATPDPQTAGRFEINQTLDLPGSTGPASFSGVLRAPNEGPFLEQVAAPRGFIGDPNVARPVRGGTNGNTVVVTGPGRFTMSTARFLVQGKIATNGGLSGVRASYSTNPAGVKTVTIRASSVGRQRIVAVVGGRIIPLRPVAGRVGSYLGTANFGPNALISPMLVVNRTDASGPSVTIDPVPDLVSISQATWVNGILTVRASSADLRSRPVLQLIDPATGNVLSARRGTLNATLRTPVKPARILVTSSAGGRAGAIVR